MPRRTFRFLQRVAILLVLTVAAAAPIPSFSPAAETPVSIAAASPIDPSEVDRLLAYGQRLEQESRWGEALSCYEQSLRRFPDSLELAQRKALARIHYDLERRYADPSYRRSIVEINETAAMELYTEVLRKIATHYVHDPRWQDVLQQGHASLDVALTQKSFLENNLSGVAPERVRQFRFELRRRIEKMSIRDWPQCRQAVVELAHEAHRQLGLAPAAVILEYVSSAASSLDPYSSYLTENQLAEVYSQIEGNFVGLGVELKPLADALLIVEVIQQSPAALGGVRRGEKIVAVDNISVVELTADKAADRLRGPEGSTVALQLVDSAGAGRSVRLVRRLVEVPSVTDAKIVDPQYHIGYFRLTAFQKTTPADIDAALWSLHRQGMRSLIVDVRGNPGGLLTAGVEAADKFIDKGPIVLTRGRSTQENYDYNAHQAGTWQIPLIVLIDGDSASASEIFAGAIRDSGRGTIVGLQSYGKGSVQGIFPLFNEKAGIRLTTAKFYSPSGTPISGRGVVPDIAVHQAAKPIVFEDDQQQVSFVRADAPEEDLILAAGLEAARGRLAQTGPNGPSGS